jgi:hypothetical protein
MIENLFRERDFVEPKHLESAKILSKTAQWQLRKTGVLPHLRIGKKVLYSRHHLETFFTRAETLGNI